MFETPPPDPPTPYAPIPAHCPGAWGNRFAALAPSSVFAAPASALPGARQGKPRVPVKENLGRIGSQVPEGAVQQTGPLPPPTATIEASASATATGPAPTRLAYQSAMEDTNTKTYRFRVDHPAPLQQDGAGLRRDPRPFHGGAFLSLAEGSLLERLFSSVGIFRRRLVGQSGRGRPRRGGAPAAHFYHPSTWLSLPVSQGRTEGSSGIILEWNCSRWSRRKSRM